MKSSKAWEEGFRNWLAPTMVPHHRFRDPAEPTLKDIACELVTQVRKSVTIDWTLREAAQAQIRVIVRRILRKYGYPPDKQEKATQTVLEQAKLLCAEWV